MWCWCVSSLYRYLCIMACVFSLGTISLLYMVCVFCVRGVCVCVVCARARTFQHLNTGKGYIETSRVNLSVPSQQSWILFDESKGFQTGKDLSSLFETIFYVVHQTQP